MQTHPSPAYSSQLSQMEENGILSEIESLLHANSVDRRIEGAAGATVRRRFPLYVLTALIAIAAIVPVGFRKGDMLGGRSTHQAANERSKPS